MTSFTKPEVYNVLHWHHRRTKRQPQTCTEMWWNMDMWFLKYTSRQTYRLTCWLQFCALYWGQSNKSWLAAL